MTRRFSANLGFLWNDLPLADAIARATEAGFDAVECHFPYEAPPTVIKATLADHATIMVSLNTFPGDMAKGEFGLAALPGRQYEARLAIAQAIDYAAAIGCKRVHVMAGKTSKAAAGAVFASNLHFACELARPHGISVLIEPLNAHDAQGYFLSSFGQALDLISALGEANLRLMFDAYHCGRIHGDVEAWLRRSFRAIGHVQIAAVPDRGEPDRGEIDYRAVLAVLDELGWEGFIGAEYRPRATVEEGLGWLRDLT